MEDKEKLESLKVSLTSLAIGTIQMRALLIRDAAPRQLIRTYLDKQSALLSKALKLLE